MRLRLSGICLSTLFSFLAVSLLSVAGCGQDAAPLRSGEWNAYVKGGDDLFTSWIVANATREDEPLEENEFGHYWSELGIELVAPQDDSRVQIQVTSTKLIATTRAEYVLPIKGETYHIYPRVKFDYDQLLSVRQTFPEDISFTVSFDGQEADEQIVRVKVRPITECCYVFLDEEEETAEFYYEMFAAYVNEDHPLVDEILNQCHDKKGKRMSFAGYQGNADDVIAEVESIWSALKKRGYRYSDITSTSRESDEHVSQHVRMLGDSYKTSQANCVDGSVLFASIMRKIGLEPFLALTPEHMFVGVFLGETEDEFIEPIGIETTMMGTGSFRDAVEAGDEALGEMEEKLDDEDNMGHYDIVVISDCRQAGVMPLKDVRLKK